MQAILRADYSFTPLEYWRGVSVSAREFIKRCLTIDPNARMTSHQALQHPFVAERLDSDAENKDLLPVIKKNFNARRTLHAAIDTIRAINKLREGGAAMGMMDGVISGDPKREDAHTAESGGERMEIDSRGNARGQTEEQIKAQERRVMETSRGLWGGTR